MTTWIAMSVPGVCVSAFARGPGATVGAALAVAVPLSLALVVHHHGHRLDRTQHHGQDGGPRDACPAATTDAGRSVRVVACAVAVLVCAQAISLLAPGLALAWILLCAGTTPPAVRLRRRLATRLWTPARGAESVVDTQVHASPVPPQLNIVETVHDMTDAELCRAWRRSFWTLHDTHYPAAKLGVVEQRHLILDELEVRHTAALQAWFDTGARASAGPEQFLPGGDDQSPAA